MDINDMLIEENNTILAAMEQLDIIATKVLFVHSNKKLVATLTDGDIRRWILKKGSLTAEIYKVANYSPRFLRESEKSLAQEFMKRYSLQAVPILDDENYVLNIYFWNGKEFCQKKEDIDIPVVMMAGGKGTRLFPYTKVLPKPLIPVGDLTIAELIIRQFCDCGCHDYYMIINYKKNMIKAYFNEIERDYNLCYVDEDKPLGTGGGLSLLKGRINETFILTNCDILIREDFRKICDLHRKNHRAITMVCAVKNFQVPYGVVEIAETGVIENMREKPDISFLTNTGCYIVEPEVLDILEPNTHIDFPDIITLCKQKGMNVGIYPVGENAWLDMGQMDELEKMRKSLNVE